MTLPTPSNTSRKGILAAVTAHWKTLYGPAGTTGKWFRDVKRGPVQPIVSGYPLLICHDGGQKRVEDEESESSWTKELTLFGVLQLAENWTRVSPSDDWTDRVETLINATNRYRLAGFGIERFDYVDDDPADVVFLDGQSSAIWQVQFSVRYFDGI